MAELAFWENLVDKGIIDSFDDGAYYSTGQAGEGEYAHAIQVAFNNTAPGSEDRKALIDALYEGGAISGGNREYWYDGAEDTIGPDFDNLGNAAESFFQGSGGTIDVAPTATQDPSAEPVVDPGEPFADDPEDDPDLITPEGEGVGIMAGGTLHRVNNAEGQQDFYVVSYEYPEGSGHEFFYRFQDLATLKASIGEGLTGVTIGANINEDALGQWTDGGDSNEILGITGSFVGFINDTIRIVSDKSGIGDPTRLTAALLDPGIQLVMAKAAEGGWNDAQVKAAMRNEPYYQDVVYPGIKNFYGMTDNPEAAYALYKQNVTHNLQALGIPKDADGSYDTQMTRLLDAGVSDVEFNKFTPTYLRATGNEVYRQNLNKWLEAAGVSTLTDFDSFYDVLAGTEPQDVAEVVELAGISFVAGNQGFDVGEDMIREIAARTDLDESEIARAFSESDRDLLALGPAGMRTLGITAQDVISTRAGFTRGARSIEEMNLQISKAKKEQGIADDPTATIFTDFNREGAPVKKGLQSTISEGA